MLPCLPGTLISNRGDAFDPYDAYPAGLGIPCKPSFITQPPAPNDRLAGITWDGRFFYTSDINNGLLWVYDSSGTPSVSPSTKIINLPAGYPAHIEDLSIDYARLYCYPPKPTVYSNGPVDGQSEALTIGDGPVVSNSFVISGIGPTALTKISGFCVGLWTGSNDHPQVLDWSITSAPNAGIPFGSGTCHFSSGGGDCDGLGFATFDFLFRNNDVSGISFYRCAELLSGCDVYQASVSFGYNLKLPPDTYYLNLSNGLDEESPMGWDVNMGVNCSSPGCPSYAYVNGIPILFTESESFSVH
jgi:hypothetical protein